MRRGFYGIGVYRSKFKENLGTLWRSAHAFGADFLFTVSHRYQLQPSDTTKAWRHVPLFHYDDLPSLLTALPKDSALIGVEGEVNETHSDPHVTKAMALLEAMAETWAEKTGIGQELRVIPVNCPTPTFQERSHALMIRYVKQAYMEGLYAGFTDGVDYVRTEHGRREAKEKRHG